MRHAPADLLRTALREAAMRAVEAISAFNRTRLPRDPAAFAGINRPVTAERTVHDLPVAGDIPPDLDGTYLKMGANPADPDPSGQHHFLGDGMVHGVRLGSGRAEWYRNRWILSRPAARALNRPPAPGPRRGRSDTVNTNVVPIAGRIFALVEAGSTPVELSPDLDVQAYQAFDSTLQGAFSGHPHLDPATGELHAICYDGATQDRIHHVVVSPQGRVVREEPIPVSDGPCIHDCGLTARFVIVLDLPVTFSFRRVLSGHVFPFRWNPAHRARVGLLPRGGRASDIVWCDVEPCFVFHVGNAFDAPDGRVVLDVVVYETMFATSATGLDAAGHLERWTIDPRERRVRREILDPTPQEFPRIDERFTARPHRFLFATEVSPTLDKQFRGATRLFRHNLVAQTRAEHDFGPDRVPGEFTFVPARPDASEGEGWLLGFVIDVPADATDLVILDAADIAAPPRATIRLPHRIPPGFHGNWFPARPD